MRVKKIVEREVDEVTCDGCGTKDGHIARCPYCEKDLCDSCGMNSNVKHGVCDSCKEKSVPFFKRIEEVEADASKRIEAVQNEAYEKIDEIEKEFKEFIKSQLDK